MILGFDEDAEDNAMSVLTSVLHLSTDDPKEELRAQALGKHLKSNTVEAMSQKHGLIFKGHLDMGNALYADWVEGNFNDIAGRLNTEKKGMWSKRC